MSKIGYELVNTSDLTDNYNGLGGTSGISGFNWEKNEKINFKNWELNVDYKITKATYEKTAFGGSQVREQQLRSILRLMTARLAKV